MADWVIQYRGINSPALHSTSVTHPHSRTSGSPGEGILLLFNVLFLILLGSLSSSPHTFSSFAAAAGSQLNLNKRKRFRQIDK